MTVLLRIEYDEFVPDTYRGVVVEGDDAARRVFFTGDVVEDWRAAFAEAERFGRGLFLTSSVDHFISDSKGAYDWENDDQGHLFIIQPERKTNA